MSVKPITPKEAVEQKVFNIPDEVIESFNELIASNLDSGGSATILQKDVIKLIMSKMPKIKKDTIFKKGWLDVEDLFRKAGWTVSYDKPGYCEDYEASFEFSKKRLTC